MRRAALVIAVIAGLGVDRADANTVVELPNTKARIELPDPWTRTTVAGLVAAYKDDRGGVLAIARADVPNPDAWKSETRLAYVERIERGIRAKVGVKKSTKKVATIDGIPTLDVEATRDDGTVVLVRVLLFRTYALSLAIEVPAKGDVSAARGITATFATGPGA